MNPKKILIAGGSGTIGQSIIKAAARQKHEVKILSRSTSAGRNDLFHWNPIEGKIDREAIEWADAVINLTGAGIADSKWTKSRKKELTDSRIISTKVLVKAVNASKNKPESFIQGTAIGIYGNSGSELMREESSARKSDFLVSLCREWEAEALNVSNEVRLVICRTGVVLSRESGIIPRMKTVSRLGILSPLGSGEQWLSWIHVDDLSKMMLYLINNQVCKGIYNAVAPIPVQNKIFAKGINMVMKRANLAPPVPGFVLKLLYGEMSSTFLGGQMVSNERIQALGFRFKFDLIVKALNDVLVK